MDLLQIAIDAALEAGKIVMDIYNNEELVIESKTDNSPVTQADLASNNSIRKALSKTGYKILSEESADDLSRLEDKELWIVDPIDGTKDFIKHNDEFCIMIGFAFEGKAKIGVVYCPAVDKLYFAEKGKGAFMKSKGKTVKIKVSGASKLSESKLVISRNHFTDELKLLISKLGLKKYKNVGSNGLKIGLVSEGEEDLVFNRTNFLNEWDVCASHIILEEAGGKITAINGAEISYNNGLTKLKDGMIASNGILHEEIVRRLSNKSS